MEPPQATSFSQIMQLSANRCRCRRFCTFKMHRRWITWIIDSDLVREEVMEGQVDSYRVNSPLVVHEVFEDEAVIINLESGNYYSLEGTGRFIWTLLSGGLISRDVVQAISKRFEGETDAIASSLRGFISKLTEEGLIVSRQDENGDVMTILKAEKSEDAASGTKLDFTEPIISKYTDMQELLLLDPIHEVDDLGWPTQIKE